MMPADSVNPLYDIICIGAGPTGLACAIEANRAGQNRSASLARMECSAKLKTSRTG
jgi:thioredoxin reductase